MPTSRASPRAASSNPPWSAADSSTPRAPAAIPTARVSTVATQASPFDLCRHHDQRPWQVTFVAFDEVGRSAQCGDHALERLRRRTAVQRILDGGLR